MVRLRPYSSGGARPSPEFGTQSGSETEEYEDIQLSQGLKDEERRQSSRRKSRRLNANAPVNDSEERDSLAIADYHQGEGEGEGEGDDAELARSQR